MTALELSRERGLDWLLHIDSDELFYCQEGVSEHFKDLKAKNIGTMTYCNFEGVPEKVETEDFFR